MEPEYARGYGHLSKRHWWWRARRRMVAHELRQMMPAGGWESILDVGCGDGDLFPYLRTMAAHIEGIEENAEMVTSRHAGIIHNRSFDHTFQPGRRYSLILMLDVLEHTSDPIAFLRHAAALLKFDGLIFITVPAFPILWTQHDDINHHCYRFTRASVRDVAKQSGIAIVRSRYFFHWLFLGKLGLRLKEGLWRAKPTLPTVPAPRLNSALEALSYAEYRLLSSSRVPFGSSVMVIGRPTAAVTSTQELE